ncbi:hypothetical protein BJD20_09435 [Acinetobacter proteolyticus]|uniref:hypothetical protein n=1 Tax=Acinetobacter proteolyticus TaxID=1776741 RepID=UPI0008634341|nr:hypothetical protein [Acinetobacter proteolyticus]OEY92117.1 hypothetical protein BJD20_09435 [Acinetobacter proteolyticus]
MTRYYLVICSLFACFPLFAQESIHRAVYQLPPQTEIVVNKHKDQAASSVIKVSIRISPEKNGLKIQLFKASNSDILNRHALALAQQIKPEDLPTQETSAEQRDHTNRRLFSNYEQVYSFISMQDQAVTQRIRRVASPSSLTEMACLLLQKSVPLEGESFRLNVKLYIDKEGKIHQQQTQPVLEKSLMNQLFPDQKRTQPFYKIFDLERQQYTDMSINQPVRFICTA